MDTLELGNEQEDILVVVGKISLEGFEEREGEELVVTADDIRKELGIRVPACFLEKIELVKAKEPIVPLQVGDITRVGNHLIRKDGSGNLEASGILIHLSPRVPLGMTDKIKSEVRDIFMETLFHEVAHSIYYQLTDSERIEWQRVSETEKHDDDFCEVYQQAVLRPMRLRQESVEKFNYMMSFILSRMDDEQRQVFLLAASKYEP